MCLVVNVIRSFQLLAGISQGNIDIILLWLLVWLLRSIRFRRFILPARKEREGQSRKQN